MSDVKVPQVWTVSDRAMRDVRATQPGGWPGVRGVTVIGTLWGGDALALSAGVVRWFARVLAAATPGPEGAFVDARALMSAGPADDPAASRQMEADVDRERERSETFSKAHLEVSRLAATLGDRVENLERALVAKRVDVTELRRALHDVLAEVARGQARIMASSASPACEKAQDALARYGVPRPSGVGGQRV